MFFEVFSEVLDEISQELENDPNHNSPTIESIIKIWAQKIDLPQDAIDDIIGWYQNDIQNIISKNICIFKFTDYYILQWYTSFKDFLADIIEKKINMKNMETTFIVIIALVVVGVGYVIYQSKKSSKNKQTRTTTPTPSRSDTITDTTTLLLVINAQKYDNLISSLKEDQSVFNDTETLQSATRYCFMCPTNQLPNELKQRFHDNNEAIKRESEYSESDVYLVKIELTDSIDGFKRDRNTLNRLDAFRELPQKIKSYKVSQRLSSEAYANHFYN